ncbi:MAG TPA: GNAT family N-acetyltransferase [Chitinophagales bacterium]|nr:GNAT family N-acetyltransferase [Chitinophagales bacterium]
MLNIRFATRADNEQLIALTASTPMLGTISLRIDRKPDFFRLLNERGDSNVLVAEVDGRIVGCISVSRQQVYINGQIHEVYYLGDFKIDSAHRGLRISLKMIDGLKQYAASANSDLFFCTAADGNDPVFPFFDGRLEIPPFQYAGSFNVFQFVAFKKKIRKNDFTMLEIPSGDELRQFLNHHYSNFQLGAVVNEGKLRHTTNIGLRSPAGQLVGAICLQDTLPWKQNVVVGVSAGMKFLMRLAKLLRPVIGMSSLPELGQPVRMLYAKYFVAKDTFAAKQLIEYGRNLVYNKNYSFLALGVHEKDPLTAQVKGFPKFTFRSHAMITSLKKNQSLIDSIKRGVMYEDYSLV